MVQFDIRNPSQVFADYVVAKLNTHGPYTLKAQEIQRTYLKDLVMTNVSLSHQDTVVAEAPHLSLKGGIPLLLRSILFGSETLSVDVKSPTLYLDDSTMSTSPNPTSPILKSWMDANTFMLEADNLAADIKTNGVDANLQQTDVALTLKQDQKLPDLDAKAKKITVQNENGTVTLEQTDLKLQHSGSLTVSSDFVSYKDAKTEVSFEKLIGQTSLSSLSLADQSLDLSFSLSNLKTQRIGISLSVPTVSSTMLLSSLTVSDVSLSYDSLMLEYGAWNLQIPTSTIKADIQPDTIKIGLVTKEKQQIVARNQSNQSAQADSLIVSAVYDRKQDQVDAQLSLDALQLADPRLNIDLNAVKSTIQMTTQDATLLQVRADLSANSNLQLPLQDIQLQSPVQLSFSYRPPLQNLTGSLTFAAITSSLAEQDLSARFAYQGTKEGSQLQAEIGMGTKLLLQSVYDLPLHGSGTLSITGRFEQFPISVFAPAIERYAPFIKPYYQTGTTIIGNLSFQSQQGGGTVLPFDGRLAIDLALLSVKVGKFSLDAGFTFLSDIVGDSVQIDALTLATSGYRLAFNGSTELNHWLPRGTLDLFRTDDGLLLGTMQFSDVPPSQYRFRATTPLAATAQVEGMIRRQRADLLGGEGTFSLLGTSYPFTFTFNTSNLHFTLQQEQHLGIISSLAPPVTVTLHSDRLTMPDAGFFANASLSGDLSLSYATLHDWQVQSTLFKIEGVNFEGNTYSLQSSLEATPTSLALPDLVLSDGKLAYTSRFLYTGSDIASLISNAFHLPFKASFVLDYENIPKIEAAIVSKDDAFDLALNLSSLQLDRFRASLEGTVVDLSLVGSTDLKTILSLGGVATVQRGEQKFSTKIDATSDLFRLYDSSFTMKDASFNGDLLTIGKQQAESKGRIETVRHLSYIDQPSHLNYGLTIKLPELTTLFDIQQAIKPILGGRLDAELTLSDLLVLGEGGFRDGTYAFSLDKGTLRSDSDLLHGSYDFKTGHLQAEVDPAFGLGFSLQGSVDPSDFNLKVSAIHFPLALLNRTFLKPIFSFLDGTAQGEVLIGGTLQKPLLYGQLYVDSSRMQLFWLPEDVITMKNASATIDGSRMIIPRIPFFSTNKITGKTVQGYGYMGAIMNGWQLDTYEIHADSKQEMVYVWLPMQNFDADIRTYAGGTFNLTGKGFETWLSGSVQIQDTTMTLGIKDLPYWYESNNLTSTDFTVTTGKNVTFFYPNTPNPFIKATITENQAISFAYDHITDAFNIDGNLSFRSGELYYFQKNFFITEGSLALHTDALTGKNQIQPTINLRAKLSDFDANGNRVDIFLVLRDSGLTNLNPQFESIPAKSVNEILEILGQSILPTGAYGQVNLYSVASLAAAATDVAGRLGYLDLGQTTLLTESIRTSLGLDMFSLRSNILQNILFDALPGANLGTTLTPLARYLNNTSIFMGKYIGKQFFLQALVHLSAMDRTKVTRSFISPDLSLDLELSLDWENPLGTFSFFTQPNELSFTTILDTIGFSVTKRIVLR
jgi:hypothetical protein